VNSLVYLQANTYWSQGHYEEAKTGSIKARTWNGAAVVGFVATVIILVVVYYLPLSGS